MGGSWQVALYEKQASSIWLGMAIQQIVNCRPDSRD